ncbi:MAG: dienelactone hydrolase family protein [Armatimonadota bacterium]
MKTENGSELDRRALLKGATAGVVGAGVAATALAAAPEAAAQDKGALKDEGVLTETIRFQSGGDTISGFLARPRAAARRGTVIIIPGIFGITDQIKETTAQVAQAGLNALALDFYARKGGAPETNDFNVLRTFVAENAPDKQIVQDAQAAIDHLEKQPYANDKFGITGFCMGGRITLLVAAASPDIDAASPYYGPVRAAGPTNLAPIEMTEKIKAPVQGHYGATDRNPSPEDVRAFYAKLKETNPHAEFHIYEGAGHAFQDWTRPSYNAEAARTAWGRTVEFFQKHLK